MQKIQKGFTLIELVVVIVLLGILGVTALGKFQDLSTDAQTAANSGIASELTAGATINYAARLLDPLAAGTAALNTDGITCASLVDGGGLSLLTTALPVADYTLAGGPGACATNGPGTTFSCTVVSAVAPAGVAGTASILCSP